MDLFRLTADLAHMTSKIILIFAIHINRSAEGVSLITQALYTLVFITRYFDLLWQNPFSKLYLTVFKVVYIATSIYIQYVMVRVFTRSHERERSYKIGIGCFLFAALLTIPLGYWFEFDDHYVDYHPVHYFFWTFSIILESVCVLPQLFLLRQTNIPTVIDSYYLVTLGSYRAFYLMHWIYMGVKGEHVTILPVLFGTVQTILYLDFAWVYYTRQRVKLRNGGVVDSDDLQRGWIISRLFHRVGSSHRLSTDGGEQGTGRSAEEGRNWGARGISVSADEDLDRHHDDHEAFDEQRIDPDTKTNGAAPKKDYKKDAQGQEAMHILTSDDEDEDATTLNDTDEWWS